MNEIFETAKLIKNMWEGYSQPFPYNDCKKLLNEFDANTEEIKDNFIPELSRYLSEISGYCSWGEKILEWPNDKIIKTLHRLSFTFFERFPYLAAMKEYITLDNEPDLFKDLEYHENLRITLINLLGSIMKERKLLKSSTL